MCGRERSCRNLENYCNICWQNWGQSAKIDGLRAEMRTPKTLNKKTDCETQWVDMDMPPTKLTHWYSVMKHTQESLSLNHVNSPANLPVDGVGHVLILQNMITVLEFILLNQFASSSAMKFSRSMWQLMENCGLYAAATCDPGLEPTVK